MTASVLEEDRAECRAAGMSEFIAKPIELAALAAVLERVAEPSPVESSPTTTTTPTTTTSQGNGSVSSLLRTDDEQPVPPRPPQKS